MVRIYTRSGDAGETSLVGGERIPKNELRLEVLGTLDELNALLGLARSLLSPSVGGAGAGYASVLDAVQAELFAVGAELATPSADARRRFAIAELTDQQVLAVERHIDDVEKTLPPLQTFILPGGTSATGALHLARAVCRRAERRAFALSRQPGVEVNSAVLRYLNRLSDLLFVLARAANRAAGVADVPWRARLASGMTPDA
jgi:cob(I)alamin adenosyltransferase